MFVDYFDIDMNVRKKNIQTYYSCYVERTTLIHQFTFIQKMYEDWNFNSGNYLFTTDTK